MMVTGGKLAACVVVITCCATGRWSAAQVNRPVRSAAERIAPAAERAPPQLPPPKITPPASRDTALAQRSPIWIGSRVGAVLAVFLGLIFLQRWLTPRDRGGPSNGLIQICGKVSLDARRSLQLVRVGQRLLVLLESPQGMQRLAEISDPMEVRRLLQASGITTSSVDSQRVNQLLSEIRQGEHRLA